MPMVSRKNARAYFVVLAAKTVMTAWAGFLFFTEMTGRLIVKTDEMPVPRLAGFPDLLNLAIF